MRKEALCAKTPTEEYLVRARKCEDKADALEATMKELITERVLAASVEMPGVSFPLIHGELMVRSGGCYCERSGELQMERTDYEAKAMGAASARQPYVVQFTCTLPNDKQQLGGAELYLRGEQLVLVPTFQIHETRPVLGRFG